MALICGIDEAGRGPVIGPMVVAGVVVDEEDLSKLEKIGVKDSKLLPAKKREKLYDKIIEIVSGYELLLVPPSIIDQYVLSANENDNLNWLEATRAADAINKLNPDKVIVDCPSPNITAFTKFLRERVNNKKIHIVCEHKADFNHVVCAAASILAKVMRDNQINQLKNEIGIDFGSGYPSDPKTADFLENYWDKYDVFRKSWSSWKKVEEMKFQKKLGEW